MTVSKNSFFAKTIRFSYFLFLVIFTLIFVSSCNRKISFLNSSVVPAARGTAKVKMDDNKNHSVEISLVNLAEPERLTPARKMYMVWMETDQGMTKNLGQIKTDNGTFSKTLKANFKTVSSFTPIKIFITAENDSDIQFPSSEVIMTTARF